MYPHHKRRSRNSSSLSSIHPPTISSIYVSLRFIPQRYLLAWINWNLSSWMPPSLPRIFFFWQEERLRLRPITRMCFPASSSVDHLGLPPVLKTISHGVLPSVRSFLFKECEWITGRICHNGECQKPRAFPTEVINTACAYAYNTWRSLTCPIVHSSSNAYLCRPYTYVCTFYFYGPD